MMKEPQIDATGDATETDLRSEAESEFQSVGGLEVNLGDFTRTQCLLKALRLTLNNQIVFQVEEIASGVSEAGRKLKLGDVEQANFDVGRLYALFHQKTAQWESRARNLEQQMRMKAAKDPRSVSIDTMNRMKSEQVAVRGRIRTTEVQFRRLHQAVEQTFTNFKQQPPTPSESPAASSEGFLPTFQSASVAARAEIVKTWFEIESIVQANLSRAATGGYKIKFDPTPPPGCMMFLTMAGQVIRLKQLAQVVLMEDLETSQDREMTLKDFVKHVQHGVWLLRPASKPRLPE
jgi:hypothetical protein